MTRYVFCADGDVQARSKLLAKVYPRAPQQADGKLRSRPVKASWLDDEDSSLFR